MPSRRSVVLLAAALWTGLAAGGAAAQTAEYQLDEPELLPDLARIVDRGTLVVAQLNRDLPPIFVAPEDGELHGFDVDLARALAEELEVDLEIRRTAESYDEVVWQVADGAADLGISFLSRTASRAKHVLFSRPYARQSMTLLINRVKGLAFRQTCPSVPELARLAEDPGMVALEAESAYAARLRDLSPDVQPREFQTAEDVTAAVIAGEVAMSLQGELVARHFLAENPGARIRLDFCEIGRTQDQIAIAVPPGREDLLRWVDIFLEERQIDLDVAALIAHRGAWNF